MITLRLYSRPGCHLCQVLAEEIEPLIRGKAALEWVDIDRDPELAERYGLRIPVVVARGEELSGYPLDAARVERYLGGTAGEPA